MFICGLFVFLFSSCSTLDFIKDRIVSPEQSGEEVIFRYDSPSATTVNVAGEFNGWEYQPHQQRAIKLEKVNDSLWEGKAKIPPGRYMYKIVVDYTSWVLDPNNIYTVDDGRGNVNSLLIVK